MKPPLCEGCALQGDGYCEGEGPENATILLLGEALGAEEVAQGRPFVGGAGRILNFLLQKAGLRRSELYITNAVRCRPPRNRTPTEEEIKDCTRRHKLGEFLPAFNLVVLLGNSALLAVTGKTGITRWRGSVFVPQEGVKVLPTIHPAAIMRQQDMFPIVVADLQRAATEAISPDYTPPKQDYTLEGNVGHIQKFHGYTALRDAPFAFDVETNSLTPSPTSITLLGLSHESGTAVVIDNVRGALEKEALWHLFSGARTKIGHNIMFDIRHMEANGIPVAPPWFDTMIAHHLVLSDVPNDLGFVSSLYTRVPYWKHLSKTKPKWYNATDTDVAFRLYETLKYELELNGMQRIFDTSMSVLPVFEKMRSTGVRLNRTLQLKWKIALERKISALEKALTEGLGDVLFNWRSHVQLSKLLYEKLKLPRIYSKYQQKVTTNEEALKELEDLTGSKVVKTIRQLRKLSKLSSTYFTPPSTERVHSEYTLHIAANGRSSSRDPNLQNVPKGPARAIYIPEEGKVFVAADYNQIELRVAAVMSQEAELLKAFDRGDDIHLYTASQVFNVRMSEVTDYQRHRAKMTVYGLGYGRGAQSMSREFGWSVTEAQRFIDGYFYRFPKLKLWRQDLMADADKNGYLVNPYGRRRYFFGQHIAPKVYNFIPSGTAADVLYESLVALDEQCPADTRIVIQVHDDVVAECPIGQGKQTSEWLKDIMERPIDVLEGYKIPVEVRTGRTWGELK